ncbi:MAG: hypothetical protein CM1200mP41_06720 [Gammaproteobacteria bacterium]|nr:MAG: hypothetical protein CM1200mP41_06720 [Gammaproteobacteria bacterium]
MAITLCWFLSGLDQNLPCLSSVFAPSLPDLILGPRRIQRHCVLVSVLMAINLQTSFLTPLWFRLFYLKGFAPKSKIQEIYKGIIPFVLLNLGV